MNEQSMVSLTQLHVLRLRSSCRNKGVITARVQGLCNLLQQVLNLDLHGRLLGIDETWHLPGS